MGLPIVRGFRSDVAVSGAQDEAWLTGHAAGWLTLCLIQTANDPIEAPGVTHSMHLIGFTQAPWSPVGTGTAATANSTRLTAYYRIATSGSEPAWRVYKPAAADHMFYWWITFSDVDTTTPFLALTSAAANVVNPASTSVVLPGADTTGTANVMLIQAASNGRDSTTPQFSGPYVNAALANLTERANIGKQTNLGGQILVLTGEKATGGVIGNTTMSAALNAVLQSRLTLALKGTAAAPPTEPDSDFGCGGECATPIGTSVASGHWHGEIGTPFTSEGVIARNNLRSWRSTPIDDWSYRYRGVTGNKRHARVYVRFPTLPQTDCVLLMFKATAGGNSPELRYRAATQDLVGGVGTSVTTATVVVPGRWYECNLKGDVSVNPRTVSLNIDGVDKGTANFAFATSSMDQVRLGAACDEVATADVLFDDFRTGANVATYPYGPGSIIGLQLVSDGVHSYNASGDFKYDGLTNVPTGALDTYSHLLGILSNVTERSIALGTASVGEYLEWLLGGMPAATAIKFIEIISAHGAVLTSAHKQSLRLISGVNTQDLLLEQSFPHATPAFPSTHLTKAPGGATWTQALVNALKFRYASGWASALIAGTPKIFGLFVEVEATGLATVPDEGSEVQNPTHTFPAPGTYPVTLTVTDNSGLTASVTKMVTVP
jgi:hypothetical protein